MKQKTVFGAMLGVLLALTFMLAGCPTGGGGGGSDGGDPPYFPPDPTPPGNTIIPDELLGKWGRGYGGAIPSPGYSYEVTNFGVSLEFTPANKLIVIDMTESYDGKIDSTPRTTYTTTTYTITSVSTNGIVRMHLENNAADTGSFVYKISGRGLTILYSTDWFKETGPYFPY